MQQAETRRVLVPQFSLRWLLAVTTVCAVVFSIAGLGLRGKTWAAGVSIGILSLVVLVAVYALVFALVWLFSALLSLVGRGPSGSGRSPFKGPSAGSAKPPDTADVPATPILLE